MSEQQLRDALKTLTGPADAPRAAEEIIAGARRRQIHRVATTAIGTVAAAALVAAVVLWSPWRGDEAPNPADTGTDTATEVPGVEGWSAIAESPLSERTGAASVWTGSEMLVAGGVTGTCPPGADCAGYTEDQILADGAAYDPATDTWRQIADAPMALVDPLAVWTGTEMVVLATEYHISAGGEVQMLTGGSEYRLLGYDPEADSWREISHWAGTPFDRLVLIDETTIAAYSTEDDLGQRIHVFDLATGLPERLPLDPFGAGYDRSLVWTGSELVLAELPTDDESGTFQLASITLDGDAWVELPASPVSFWSTRWFVFDGHIVNPSQEALATSTDPSAQTNADGAYDLATGTWSRVPQLNVTANDLVNACQMPAVGAAGEWLSGGAGSLVALDPAVATLIPPCGGQAPTAAVWTGSAFVIWGGEYVDWVDVTAQGWTWTPPDPSEL